MIVLQILLKIICYLILFVLLLVGIICLSSVAVKLRFWDGKFTWGVCYFGIQIFPFRKKKKAKAKKMKKSEKSGKSEKTEISEISENSENPDDPEIPDKPELSKNSQNSKNYENSEKSEIPEEPEKSEKSENPEKKAVFKMDQKLKSWQKLVSKIDMAGSACVAIPGTLRIFAGALQWCDIRTDITVGGEDAFETARNYGLLQGAVQNLLAQSGIWIKVRRKDIRIACDFTQDQSNYNLQCTFRLHIGRTILAVLYFIIAYFLDKFRTKSAIENPKL